MKRKIASIFIVLALILTIVPCAFAAGSGLDNFKKVNTYTQGQFKDVASTAWYAGSVKAGYEYGLILGSSSTSYSPDGYMTLSEAIALAARLHSIYYTGSSSFVQGTPWYQVYIDYAIENGIIKDGQYANYSAKATRAQFAAIFAAALPETALTKINQISVGTIPDVTGTESYGNAVYLLYRAGILTGSNAYGTFNPLKNIQRSEVAAIVTRMADVSLRKTVTLATAKQRAIDCLRNFIMSNYDPDFSSNSEKEYWETYETENGYISFFVGCEENNHTVYAGTSEVYNGSTFIILIYFDETSNNHDVIYSYFVDNNPTDIPDFYGEVCLDASLFNGTNLIFSHTEIENPYSGDIHAHQQIASPILCDTIAFVNYIFSDYLSTYGNFSMELFGFTNVSDSPATQEDAYTFLKQFVLDNYNHVSESNGGKWYVEEYPNANGTKNFVLVYNEQDSQLSIFCYENNNGNMYYSDIYLSKDPSSYSVYYSYFSKESNYDNEDFQALSQVNAPEFNGSNLIFKKIIPTGSPYAGKVETHQKFANGYLVDIIQFANHIFSDHSSENSNLSMALFGFTNVQ